MSDHRDHADFPEHRLFARQLGATNYERFCQALDTAAQLFNRSDAPSLAFRVDGGRPVNIVFKRGT
jgi:hypothetical protein